MSAHDRYCQQCGAAATPPSAGQFDPGPSFVDDDLSDVDVNDLPPWLQELSTSRAPSVISETLDEMPAADSVVDEQLPEWLRAARPDQAEAGDMDDAAPAPAAAQNGVATDAFSLIGEEDLPEWLRALGDEDFESEPESAPLERERGTSPGVTAEVPSVSRAWLARPRMVDPDSEAAARHEFEVVDAAGAPASEPSVARVTPVAEAEQVIARAETEPAAEEPVDDAAQRTRRVRLLILALGIVVLAFLVYIVLGGGL